MFHAGLSLLVKDVSSASKLFFLRFYRGAVKRGGLHGRFGTRLQRRSRAKRLCCLETRISLLGGACTSWTSTYLRGAGPSPGSLGGLGNSLVRPPVFVYWVPFAWARFPPRGASTILRRHLVYVASGITSRIKLTLRTTFLPGIGPTGL